MATSLLEPPVIELLNATLKGKALARSMAVRAPTGSVLFADMVGFTGLSEQSEDEAA